MITKKNIEHVPSTTGVYFFNSDLTPIYVGKAVNLKARLISHLRNSELDNKEYTIMSQATSITYKTTLSEFDALLLEAAFIKEFRPKYNISWKDDKSYLYIKITAKEPYPKVSIVRSENDGNSLYFGPFKSTAIARLLTREIRRVVPFCTQKKISGIQCFYSKIGLCDPCPNAIEKHKKNGQVEIAAKLYKIYKKNSDRLTEILNGKSNIVIRSLQSELKKKSSSGDYEGAIILRNKIEFLTELVTNRSFEAHDLETNHEYDEIVHDELEVLLAHQFSGHEKVAEYRIECFDSSNLSGINATASLVVFINSRSDKRHYRKFKIKTVHKISDFDMLSEVVRRRFKRNDWPFPHLLVIDGGKPQLRVVAKVLAEFKGAEKIPVLGIAKNPDRIIIGREPYKSVYFKENSALFRVLQALRDESHRFAKKYHVLLRKRKLLRG